MEFRISVDGPTGEAAARARTLADAYEDPASKAIARSIADVAKAVSVAYPKHELVVLSHGSTTGRKGEVALTMRLARKGKDDPAPAPAAAPAPTK